MEFLKQIAAIMEANTIKSGIKCLDRGVLSVNNEALFVVDPP